MPEPWSEQAAPEPQGYVRAAEPPSVARDLRRMCVAYGANAPIESA